MSLQSHVKLQDDIHVRLSRAKINFKKSPKDRITVQYLETRLEMIEELWAQFTLTHTQIIKDVDYEQLTSSPYTVNENGFKKGLDGSTVAQATTLGWIISGTVASASQNKSNITVMHTHLSENEILKKKLGKEHMREKQN
ncbi:hypothetical protein SFRURICE_005784 [Spodoptera frugiperda]|nr:hypothetical protein SFRURICE_005784 [Spodoptera frugiperda]